MQGKPCKESGGLGLPLAGGSHERLLIRATPKTICCSQTLHKLLGCGPLQATPDGSRVHHSMP